MNRKKDIKVSTPLTLEEFQEVEKLINPTYKLKEAFFKKFFPNIKNIDDWVLVLPKTDEPAILKFVEENTWVGIDKYAPKILAFELGSAMRSWMD